MKRYEMLASAVVVSGGLLLSNPNANGLGAVIGLLLMLIPVLVMIWRSLRGLD